MVLDKLVASVSYRLIRRFAFRLGLALVVLSAAACAAPDFRAGVASTATDTAVIATPTPTVIPTPTTTPLPTVAQVTQGVGWQTVTSLHWVGYTFPQQNVTGLRAQWVEPTSTGSAGDEEFVWIGVGGWNYTGDNIVQVGSFAYFPPNGGLNQGVWYELVPKEPNAQYPLVAVGPGDQIFASVTEVSAPPQMWRMLLVDVTTGVTFDKTVQFNSLTAYPSFVVEAPNNGPASAYGPFYPFPHWQQVTFTQMQVRVGNAWRSAASLYGYRVNMVRDGKTLATAGLLDTSSSFTATQR